MIFFTFLPDKSLSISFFVAKVCEFFNALKCSDENKAEKVSNLWHNNLHILTQSDHNHNLTQ